MQNLEQKTMTIREYTEEFYKINLRAGYVEDIVEKVARYLNVSGMISKMNLVW